MRSATSALVLFFALLGGLSLDSLAATVPGGGSKKTDCLSVFEVPAANKPRPPRTPRHADCVDGDPACDADGSRNGECVFEVAVCLNASGYDRCVPDTVEAVEVAHALDNGDREFDPDFQALQQRIDALGFPNDSSDDCTTSSTITVALKPANGNRLKTSRKKLKLTAFGTVSGRFSKDKDRMKLTCRPEGDGIYLPTEQYEGTFDRIRQQVFAQSCALSGCHDSESSAGNLILLPNAAYSQIVNVIPHNAAAANDGLLRIAPGDESLSFLYKKITFDLPPEYGNGMPLVGKPVAAGLIDIIRLWIIGDEILGPAPETGWVQGTDQ